MNDRSSWTRRLAPLLFLLLAPALARADAPRPTDSFRHEHQNIVRELDRVAARAGALRGPVNARVRAEMAAIARFFEHDLIPHAEWEERVLYPAVDRRAASPPEHPFTATMRHEHRIVGRWTRELAAAAAAAHPNVRDFVRRTDGLLGLVRAHFEEEEEVLLPVLDRTMTAQEFEHEMGHGGPH